MLYYVGKTFDKKGNKTYKTLDGAKKAADKADLCVFDEEGVKVYPTKVQLTDEVPDGALEKNADGTTNVYDEEGNVVGTMSEEEVQQLEEGIDADEVEAAAAAAKEKQEDKVEDVKGKIKRIFNGRLRLRRVPSMADSAICGVTLFDTKTVVKHHVVDGVAFYETLDGYFVKDDKNLVEFIPAE